MIASTAIANSALEYDLMESPQKGKMECRTLREKPPQGGCAKKMYHGSPPCCIVFLNFSVIALTIPNLHTIVDSHAQGPPRARPLDGAPPSVLNRVLR
jgi:hypothetical protein